MVFFFAFETVVSANLRPKVKPLILLPGYYLGLGFEVDENKLDFYHKKIHR